MAEGFLRPVAVAGLAWSGAAYAEKYLRWHGLEVESLWPTSGTIDDFLKRGGLLIWVEAPLRLRLRRSSRPSLKPCGFRDIEKQEQARRRRVLRGPSEPSDQPNPDYAWMMAQVIIHHDAGLGPFGRRLRQLAAELTYPAHLDFLRYDKDLVLQPSCDVGDFRYQVYVMGAAPVG